MTDASSAGQSFHSEAGDALASGTGDRLQRRPETTLRFLAEPTDVNFGGKVHGGTVLKWIDQASYACAVGWSGQYCVTAAMSGVEFLQPVRIGDLVSVHATVIATGRTSMRILTTVTAGNLRSGQHVLTTHCVTVFVAVDSDGRPVEVPRYPVRCGRESDLAALSERMSGVARELQSELRRLTDGAGARGVHHD